MRKTIADSFWKSPRQIAARNPIIVRAFLISRCHPKAWDIVHSYSHYPFAYPRGRRQSEVSHTFRKSRSITKLFLYPVPICFSQQELTVWPSYSVFAPTVVNALQKKKCWLIAELVEMSLYLCFRKVCLWIRTFKYSWFQVRSATRFRDS